MELANMRKGIYSMPPLREALERVNKRYIEFISSIDDMCAGTDKLNKISRRVVENDRSYKGFNFFSGDDQKLFEAIANGEFNITGFQNKNLRQKLKDKSTSQISRIIKGLRVHKLIKKIPRTYRYHLTKLGKGVIILGLKLRDIVIIPKLNF